MWTKIKAWVRRLFSLYDKEIKQFVDEMIELAFLNLDNERKEKLTPAIKKKVKNKVMADIIIYGTDIATTKGKSAVGQFLMDAIDRFTNDGDKQ